MTRCVAVLGLVLTVFLPVLAWADDPVLVIDPGGHLALIKDIMFSSDGKYLVSAGDDKVVRVWDVKTGETVRTIRGQVGDGHEGKIYAAALSAQDKYLAVGGWMQPEVQVVVELSASTTSAVARSSGYSQGTRMW